MQFSSQGARPVLPENLRTVYTRAQVDSHISRLPPWMSKKHSKFDTRVWVDAGAASVSGLQGVTFVQDAWWWQSVRRRHAGNAAAATRDNSVETGSKWVVCGRWGRADATVEERRSLLIGIGASDADSVSSAIAIDPLCRRLASISRQLSAVDLHGQPWKSCWQNDDKHISWPLVFSAKICPTFFDLYEGIYGKCLYVVTNNRYLPYTLVDFVCGLIAISHRLPSSSPAVAHQRSTHRPHYFSRYCLLLE